jgi:cell wall-associated NlpC family hydrolase
MGAHYPGSRAARPNRASQPRAARPFRPFRPAPSGRAAAIAFAALLLLAGCGGHAPIRQAAPPPRHWAANAPADPAAANAVLMRAISLVGTPYRYGGNTPEGGFDCSGLVNYVYRDMLDLKLPRTSRQLADWQGPRIAPERLAPADLVFFGSGGEVSHVGIYVGEGRFVHAPKTGGTVRLDRLDGAWWRDHYTGARRILGANGAG